HATVQAYTNANLSLGGAVGGNAGTIRNCSVDTPELSMTSLDAWVYVGGFVGMNEGTGVISDCYDLGHVVIKTSRGGSVSIAGFAGGNSGTVRSSYCATSMSVSGDAGVPYSFSPAGGTTLSCNFLTNGTYSYANHLRSYSTSVNSSGGAATTRTKLQAMQGKSKPSVSRSYNYTASEESLSGGYPYRAVVKGRGGAWVHYGDWQGEADLGTLGVFYWEHEEGGSNSGYHLTFMSAKITGKEPIEGTTLCNAHDDGGIVTDYGYGYFTKSGLDVESTTVNLGIDGADPDGTVQQRLQDQMDGYAFYPYKTGSDGLHLSTDNASVREGTWTITYSGKSHVFKVAPFFANAMSSEEGRVMVGEDGVSTDYTIEAGTEKNKYEIRSIQQLQYLNWNSVTQSTDKLVTTGNYQQFPYLQYATNLEKGTQDSKAVAANRPVQHYRQSHDLGVLEDEEFPFTPIAGSATSTTGTSYEGKLYAWFGGVFEGESYKIQNFDITSDSYTVGLFGVTVGANIRDIILYSDKGSTIQRVTPSSGGQVNESAGAYSLGGLIGVAYDYITIVNNEIVTSGNTISNCAIAGYNIVDKSENKSTAGGTNIGGLIGVANVQLEKCSAVVDILVDCLHSKGTDGNGTSVRVGGLTGAAQYSVTDCYTGGKIEVSQNTLDEKYLEGGSKTIQFANKTLVALNRNKNVHVYVAGIAGSSFTMNYVNFTNRNNTFSGSPTFKNCYTHMNLPSKVTGTLKGVSIIGGPADRYSSNTARFTVRNCYYLDSIIKNITCEAPEDYVFTASTVKVTDAEGNVSEKKANDLPANASEYFLCTEPYEDVPAGLSKVELYTVEDEGVLSRMLAGNLNDNKKIINSDGQSYTLDSDDSPISTTYAELSEDPNTGTVKLGSTWGKVTTEEGDHVAIPGKYSFPAGDERLAGADYPFPTIVTQPDLVYGGNVNVHYGTWPPESLVWEQGQANIDIFRDMDSGVAKKTFYLDDPNGVIADKIAESGRELAGYFSCSDPDVAEIHEVVVDSEYQGSGARYKVTVWAIGDGFSEVYETASGKNMKFELRVTHDLVAEAVPADTSLVGYLNDTSSLKLSAHSKPNENGGSTSSDIKDYSTSGNWGYDTSDLVVVTRGEDGQNYVSYSVEHKGAGSFVLGFTFTYTYQVPGHAEHTYSERVNVPVKTYGYIGLSGDSELLKNTTYKYDEVLRTKSGTTP
ncbi:MAG: GNAT family N-acetyltransferase, partial [Eggerthellaceae bacterium]|nr:GNAT family N-acetyltransferase [Eggerthellaceae bacterium]